MFYFLISFTNTISRKQNQNVRQKIKMAVKALSKRGSFPAGRLRYPCPGAPAPAPALGSTAGRAAAPRTKQPSAQSPQQSVELPQCSWQYL